MNILWLSQQVLSKFLLIEIEFKIHKVRLTIPQFTAIYFNRTICPLKIKTANIPKITIFATFIIQNGVQASRISSISCRGEIWCQKIKNSVVFTSEFNIVIHLHSKIKSKKKFKLTLDEISEFIEIFSPVFSFFYCTYKITF